MHYNWLINCIVELIYFLFFFYSQYHSDLHHSYVYRLFVSFKIKTYIKLTFSYHVYQYRWIAVKIFLKFKKSWISISMLRSGASRIIYIRKTLELKLGATHKTVGSFKHKNDISNKTIKKQIKLWKIKQLNRTHLVWLPMTHFAT